MVRSGNNSSNKTQNAEEELRKFEDMISELKIRYEQYFMGTVVQPPDKLHQDTVRKMRTIRGIPFLRPSQRYLLRTLEYRYKSYNDYWKRVLREKEEGKYHKDIFKAEMRARYAAEDLKALERAGAPKAIVDLFSNYRDALEQSGKNTKNLTFDSFQKILVKRAQAVKEQLGVKKVSMAVVVKNGKVTLQVKPKQEQGSE
jgi:hypothetical protein